MVAHYVHIKKVKGQAIVMQVLHAVVLLFVKNTQMQKENVLQKEAVQYAPQKISVDVRIQMVIL